MNKIFRLSEVQQITGLSKSTIYLMMKNEEFPKNIMLGIRAVGWAESDLRAWVETKLSKKQASNSKLPD